MASILSRSQWVKINWQRKTAPYVSCVVLSAISKTIVEDLEQHGRKDSMGFFGLPEDTGGSTDEKDLKLRNTHTTVKPHFTLDEIAPWHYNDVIMNAMSSQITSLTIVYLIVYSGVHQRKHQSSASLAFVWGIHRGPVNSPHKWPVTRKMLSFDDVIMKAAEVQPPPPP